MLLIFLNRCVTENKKKKQKKFLFLALLLPYLNLNNRRKNAKPTWSNSSSFYVRLKVCATKTKTNDKYLFI
jgi:hypothetical protein